MTFPLKLFTAYLLLSPSAAFLFSQPVHADNGYKVLFRPIKKQVSRRDQKIIYKMLKIEKSSQRGYYNIPGLGCDPAPFEAHAEDLNGDGIPEVFIYGGNACTSGGTGRSVSLFIKKGETYSQHLGFPAFSHVRTQQSHLGFADLRFSGAGFCEGVWRWNGQTYGHLKNVATAPGGCDHLPK